MDFQLYKTKLNQSFAWSLKPISETKRHFSLICRFIYRHFLLIKVMAPALVPIWFLIALTFIIRDVAQSNLTMPGLCYHPCFVLTLLGTVAYGFYEIIFK